MYVIRILARLRRDTRAVAMLEFAFTLPLLLLTACFGVELSNYALANLRISQVALALADNASRVGISSNLATQQLREIDVNDVIQAARKQGEQLNVTKYGRIILSSLEADSNGVQRIHWQRCLGLKSGAGYDSSYGRTTIVGSTPSTANNAAAAYDPTAGINTASSGDNSASHPGSVTSDGMGDPNAKVTAPNSSGVMFVEINYLYQPLFGSWLVGNRRIHYIASFIVRDRREFGQIYNPSPAVTTRMTCNFYTV